MKLSVRDVVAATGGWVEKFGESLATGISIDTRTIREGDLFFAIAGPNHDGHDHLGEAVAGGAAGLVLRDGFPLPEGVARAADAGEGLYVARVPDTLQALGDLAADFRRRFPGKVVAITGSNGKSTTKEMTASVLGMRWKVAKSPGNFNNLVGVPLSIFRAREDTQALVLEAGMNHPGEIARLTDICSPDVGVVTSIAPAHLEFLRDIQGVKEAKGELLERMKSNAVSVLNADDANVMALASRARGRVLTFGLHPGADLRADRMVARVDGGASFDLVSGEGRVRVRLAFLGLHNIQNAMAAAAAAYALGFKPEEIAEGLGRCRPMGQRLEPLDLPGGVRVIDDTYNANPGSVRAAVETFLALVSRGRRIVLLGDMLEMGEQSVSAHQEMGKFMAEAGVDILVTVGRDSEAASRVFEDQAGAGRWGRHAADWREASELLCREIRAGDMTLIKGSRGMTMEKVVEVLRERLGPGRGETA